MKKKMPKSHPKLLPQVLQAIADLQETRGSTTKKIVDQVQTSIKVTKIQPKPRNVVMQVRRALRHGVQTGLLKQRSGKFTLGLGKNGDLSKVKYTPKTAKRRKRRRSRRRRRKNRRRAVSVAKKSTDATSETQTEEDSTTSGVSDTEVNSESSEPGDRAKRRGKKKRRGRKRSSSFELGQRRAKRHFQNNSGKDNVEFDQQDNAQMDGVPDCNNPDCLCNMKQEPGESMRRNSDDDVGQQNSYIN